MESFGRMLKSVLVVIVLVAALQSESAAERLASCCTRVSNQRLSEPILGYLVQQHDPPCVKAIIFQTKTGFYCSQLTVPWVRRKVVAFELAKARAAALAVVPQSPIYLGSNTTSSASKTPAGETFSESDNE